MSCRYSRSPGMTYEASISAQDLNAQTAIFKLDGYLLWRIFMTIADADEGIHRLYPYHSSALHTIRRSSQVCGLWRDVILGSPCLWGAVVNLTHLQQKTDTWRNEVMRRTGEALLNVTGAVDVAQFLLFILDAHWTRIRKVDVVIYDFRSLEDERWKVFQRRAPNLESFRLGCARGTPLFLQNSSTNILFADHAPSLHEFSATQINFLIPPPWFRHIRVLQLSSCFTMPQVLDALVDAHLLEWLELQNGFTGVSGLDRFRELPTLSLPRLSRIQVRSRLVTCMEFLEHIHPARGCSLAMYTDDPSDTLTVWSSQLLDTVHRVLSRYAQGYFAAHNTKELSLDINKGLFRFSAYAESNVNHPLNSPNSHYFNIRISNKTGFTPSAISLLLRCFSSCAFTSITSLIFNFVGVHDFEISDRDFTHFISSIGSVVTLQTGIQALGFLCGFIPKKEESDTNTKPILPSLRTIKIQEVDNVHSSVETIITDFLSWRKGMGSVIESMELMVYGYATPRGPDLFFLERLAPGMEVIWKSSSGVTKYVCGSGDPDKLVYGTRIC